MNRWTLLLAVSLLFILTALGCSGGGGSPVTPGASSDLTLTGNNVERTNTSGKQFWGFFDAVFDVEKGTLEITPNRTVSGMINAVSFYNNNPSNLSTANLSITIGTGYVDADIDVKLKHPFAGVPKFSGYDFHLALITDGSGSLTYGSLNHGVVNTDVTMINDPVELDGGGPDGYTRWFNPVDFLTPGLLGYKPGLVATPGYTGNAKINPYKLYADGIGNQQSAFDFIATQDGPGNNIFASGNTQVSRNMYLRFPTGPVPLIRFNYALIASWDGPSYPAPANAVEVMAADVTVTPDLYYVGPGDYGGELKLEISLAGYGEQPSTIYVESTVFTGTYTLTGTEMDPVDGDETYSVYEVEIPSDTALTGTEGNEFWVIAAYGGADKTVYGYKNIYGTTNLAGNDPLAAFFRYDLDVASTPYCSVPTIANVNPDCLYLGSKATITINGYGFQDGTYWDAYLEDPVAVITIPMTNVTFISENTITAYANLTGQPAGTYDVVVNNGCDVGMTGTLIDGFDITSTTWAPGTANEWTDVGYDSTYDLRNNVLATQVFITDDLGTTPDTGPINPGFTFNYYGYLYSHVNIGDNGAMAMLVSASDPQNGYVPWNQHFCLANPGFMLPFCEDLDSGATMAKIYYLTQGTAPNRTFTVHYVDIPFYGTTDVNTFSITIFEGTQKIRFQYEDVDPDGIGGGEYTIAESSFAESGYVGSRNGLFCDPADFPTSCLPYKAFELDTPTALPAAPPTDTYVSTVSTYDAEYECSPSATVTGITNENTAWLVPIGFNFNYGDLTWNYLAIGDNGGIFFSKDGNVTLGANSGGSVCGIYATFNVWQDRIVALGSNLNSGMGTVKYETRTTAYLNQVFIAEWENVPTYIAPPPYNTFQIVLFNDPTSTFDRIRIQWLQTYGGDSTQDVFIDYNCPVFNGSTGFEVELCIYDNHSYPAPPSAIMIDD